MSASSASDSERLDLAARTLRLLGAPGVGPHRLYGLLETHGSLEGVEAYIENSGKAPQRVRDYVSQTGVGPFRQIMQETVARGDDFKLWSDPDYPANLGLWGARPAVLFYRGDLSHLGQRSLALVGRVDPTVEGEQSAFRFARKCVENDITVVSGLAKGIDGASHRAALGEPPGYTYAVVGHGLDFSYPAENKDLYEAIPQHGAVISQFSLGVGPQRWTFPARNEAMCTLALGTVIVEGKPGCGSIIQAEFSFKHGRPVFLLSRNLRVGETQWAEELVTKGAHVVEHFDQVLDVVQATMGELWSDTSEATWAEQDNLLELLNEDPSVGAQMNDLSKYGIFFDLDGVLADSRETTAVALAAIATRHTNREVNPTGLDVTGSPSKVLQRLGVRDSYNVYRDEYDAEFVRASDRHMRVFDDAVVGLRRLRDAGVRLAAVTAQPRRRAERLLPPEVRDMFDLYLTYNETKGKKEAGIDRALRELQVDKKHAAFVGDQSTDLEAARRSGVRGVAVLWGFSDLETLRKWPHDLMLSEPGEIGPELVSMLFERGAGHGADGETRGTGS